MDYVRTITPKVFLAFGALLIAIALATSVLAERTHRRSSQLEIGIQALGAELAGVSTPFSKQSVANFADVLNSEFANDNIMRAVQRAADDHEVRIISSQSDDHRATVDTLGRLDVAVSLRGVLSH